MTHLPDGWLAPRKEFLLNGIGSGMYLFRFDAVNAEIHPNARVKDGATHLWRAKCARCAAVLPTNEDGLRLHATLHLAKDEMEEPFSTH